MDDGQRGFPKKSFVTYSRKNGGTSSRSLYDISHHRSIYNSVLTNESREQKYNLVGSAMSLVVS